MTDLFNNDIKGNLLPADGEVYYHGRVINRSASATAFENILRDAHWQNDTVRMYGKTITTKRKYALMGNEGISYSYSGVDRKAMPWQNDVLILKAIAESICAKQFNVCLLNLYHNGDEGMSWHSDDEAELGNEPLIASLSLGATRKFRFKHKQSGMIIEQILEDGSPCSHMRTRSRPGSASCFHPGRFQNPGQHTTPKSRNHRTRCGPERRRLFRPACM